MKLAGDSLHPANRVRRRVVWVTSGADGTEHAVTDEQMIAGQTERSGVYVARCEVRFVAASLMTPELRRCTDCLLLLRTELAHHRAGHLRSGQLVRWTRRLLGVLRILRSQESPHPEGGNTPVVAARHPVGKP